MTDDEDKPITLCPAPWCGKDRDECGHVECWRRITITAGPRDIAPPPPDEDK